MITGGRDKEGNALSMDDAASNCFGFSMANGVLWLDNKETITTILDKSTKVGIGKKSFTQVGYMQNLIVGINTAQGDDKYAPTYARFSRVGTDVSTNSLVYPQKDSFHPRTIGKQIEDVLNFRNNAADRAQYSPSMLVYYQQNNKVVNKTGGNTKVRAKLIIFNR